MTDPAIKLHTAVARLFWRGVRSVRLSSYPLAAGALCLSAATLLFAQNERGDYTQRNPGSLSQHAPRPAHTDDAKYSIGSYPLYSPELPAGQGKDLVVQCIACHSTRYIIMQPPLPRDQWSAELTKMVKTYGAEIPDADQPVILDYLAAHYTPETRKR